MNHVISDLSAAARAELTCAHCGQPLPAPGDVRIDPDQRIVARGELSVRLTTQQFEAFAALYAARGHALRKTTLYQRLFFYRTEREEPEPKILDVVVCRLRALLKPLGITIETVYGAGWMLKLPQMAATSEAAA